MKTAKTPCSQGFEIAHLHWLLAWHRLAAHWHSAENPESLANIGQTSHDRHWNSTPCSSYFQENTQNNAAPPAIDRIYS
jgi:hypothetical protein